MELTIAQVIGKPIAVLDIDGRKVYDQLIEAYERHEKVVLSFKGLQHVTTAFLNAAIGRFILSASEPKKAKEMIAIENLENESTKHKIDQVYQLALNPKLRQIREAARTQELGIHE